MDVGNPSNFVRMLDMFGGDFESLSKEIIGYAFTDSETQRVMREVFSNNKYVMDPHGAVAYLGLEGILKVEQYKYAWDFFGNSTSGKIQGCSRRNVADFRSYSKRPSKVFAASEEKYSVV